MEVEMFEKYRKIINIVDSNDKTKFDKKLIADLAKGIKLVNENLPYPSFIIYILVQALVKVFEELYQTKIVFSSKCSEL